MKMMPPDVISHENQLQHLSEPSIFMLDVFRTADHAVQIFIPHRKPEDKSVALHFSVVCIQDRLLDKMSFQSRMQLLRFWNKILHELKQLSDVTKLIKLHT